MCYWTAFQMFQQLALWFNFVITEELSNVPICFNNYFFIYIWRKTKRRLIFCQYWTFQRHCLCNRQFDRDIHFFVRKSIIIKYILIQNMFETNSLPAMRMKIHRKRQCRWFWYATHAKTFSSNRSVGTFRFVPPTATTARLVFEK